MSRSRVLLWHWGRTGAGSKFTLDLAGAFVKVGRAPCCISAVRDSELATRAEASFADALHLVPQPPRRFTNVRSLAGAFRWLQTSRILSRTLEETQPDVALCTMQSIWDLLALSALRRRKIRYVLILHDAWFRVGDTYPLRAWALRRQVAASDGLIVLSNHVKKVAQSTFSYPASRILTIPHGSFEFGDADRSLPRQRRNGQPLRLLFLGRIVAYKGVGLLLEAYALARRNGINVVLSVLGDGDVSALRPQLDQLPDLTLENRWLSEAEIAAALRDADAVVLPYVEATQSGIAAAAFAAALPVIATPVGGLLEQVTHDETGLIASALDAPALAEAIARLSADDRLYAKLSNGAMRHAREDLAWDQIAVKTLAFLDAIHATPPRGSEKPEKMAVIDSLPTETQALP